MAESFMEQDLFRLLSAAVEQSSEGIAIGDLRGKLLFVNRAFADMHGYEQHDLVGKPLTVFHTPEQLPAVHAANQQTGETGEFLGEIWHVRRDGTTFPGSMHNTLIRDDAGHPIGMLATLRDVTESRRGKEERAAHVHFLESMARIQSVIRQPTDLEQKLGEILDTVLAIFGCDSAWLLHPCDPDGPSWRVPLARTRQGHPNTMTPNLEIPMTPGVAAAFQEALGSEGPITEPVAPGDPDWSDWNRDNACVIRSRLIMAIHPGMGKPWLFGMHQCSRDRIWTDGEQRLFEEIGHRTADGLSALLLFQSLRESEHRFRELFERMSSGVAVYKAVDEGDDFVIVDFNRAGERIEGTAKGDVVGRRVTEAFPGVREFGLLEVFRRVWQTGTPEQHPVHFYKDELIAGWRDNFVYRLPSGEVVAVYDDVTERKRAEEELRVNEERFRSLVESSGEGIVAYDTELRFTVWNSFMERLSGMPREEVLGRVCSEVFPFLDEVGEVEAWRAAVQGRATALSEMPFDLPSTGASGYFESSHFPLMDLEGRVVGGMGVIRDMTERKRAEEEIRRAKESAEAASRAKSEFVANMSHELRTPMSGVIGGARLLLDTPLTEEQRRLTELVRMGGEAQLAVINDILDFSKIEAGKLTIESYPFDLDVAVREVQSLLMSEAERKKIRLDTHYAPGTPCCVVGDAGRIGQVLTNLVGNAVKFTKEGWVTVTVICEDQGHEAARFRVTVEDTGIGISEEKVSQIFEKFSQVDGSTTRRYEGTGLGLAISKQLVELMGGEIGVTSRLGEGSAFWFTVDLPLAAEPLPAPEEAAGVPPQSDTTVPAATAHCCPTRVLVAEDNILNQKVIAQMLEQLGCRVDVAATGKDVLEMLKRFPYDLVFMDCMMPVMSGFEATVEIRRLEGEELHTPIVAMTALAMEGDRERCMEAGMDDYLSKPVTLERLRTTVVKWGQVARSTRGEAHRRDLSLLDPAALAKLRELDSGTDESFLEEIFNDFVENVTATLALLREAARAADAKALTRAANSIKGASEVIGAHTLGGVCEQVQALGEADSLAQTSEWIDQLELEFRRVKDALVI